MRSLRLYSVTVCLGLSVFAGCSEKAAGPDNSPAPAPVAQPAATLTVVTTETENLLFRYQTDTGFESASRIDEIPESARGAVQVVDLSASPEARGSTTAVQLFDLRAPDAQGRFAGRFVPRADLEKALAAAQEAARPKTAAVTMYSASWCGVCKKARSFMTKQGLPFVEKDIEKDPKAAKELQAKAAKAGVSASGVPVFDVGGKILPGFDPKALMAAAKAP